MASSRHRPLFHPSLAPTTTLTDTSCPPASAYTSRFGPLPNNWPSSSLGALQGRRLEYDARSSALNGLFHVLFLDLTIIHDYITDVLNTSTMIQRLHVERLVVSVAGTAAAVTDVRNAHLALDDHHLDWLRASHKLAEARDDPMAENFLLQLDDVSCCTVVHDWDLELIGDLGELSWDEKLAKLKAELRKWMSKHLRRRASF